MSRRCDHWLQCGGAKVDFHANHHKGLNHGLTLAAGRSHGGPVTLIGCKKAQGRTVKAMFDTKAPVQDIGRVCVAVFVSPPLVIAKFGAELQIGVDEIARKETSDIIHYFAGLTHPWHRNVLRRSCPAGSS